jgi:arylamine N-acetyltransferase
MAESAAPPSSSADLAAARLTAAHIGADLSCFTFDTAEALVALGDVIAHLESYDVGLVRVAVPLFLLARKVAASGCRAVLVGEGADEVFGGYAFFQPYVRETLPAFQRELERRLACIAASELLKVDRCTMASGVEARVPFLDAAFLSLAMHDSCAERKLSHPSTGRLEKSLLRDAFAGGWLPDDVLWRRKEGMADGVGFRWVQEVQCEAVRLVAIDDPGRAEAALYRRLFCERAAHSSRVALAEARIAARNAGRPGPLAALVSGSAFIRSCKSLRDDPQLSGLFSQDEAAGFCSATLGVEVASRPPTLALLNRLIEAVLQRVPFHNFSLLTRPRIPPTRDEVRDDWLRCLGGTCAFTSPAFAATLSALGFQVFLVASAVRREFDHLALLVLVEGRFHYVDVGNGKRYLEAAPLGDDRPLGCAASFTWRVRWDAAAARFNVIHGSQGEDGETLWNAAPSVTFDPQRLVHYSFFHEHFARARLDPANVFLHGLRFAVFPRLDVEVSIRDAVVTLGSASRVSTRNEDELLAFARSRMNSVQVAYLQAALSVLRQQSEDLWCR